MKKIIGVWLLIVIVTVVLVTMLSIPLTAVLWLIIGLAGFMALFFATGGMSMLERRGTPKVETEDKDENRKTS
jgi:hypothetical protein